MSMQLFRDHGIDVPSGASGEVQTTCPKCSRDRKKKNARCLSVNVEKGAWNCHHCGWSGGLERTREDRPKQYRRPDPRPRIALPQNAIDWLHWRGITDEVILRNRLDYGRAYFPQLQDQAEAVIFPYFRGGEEINRKYRTVSDKHFRMETGCELVLYGLDDIDPTKPLIWVEGEIDKLALEVAGYRNVVSVPNGAPPAGTKNYDARLSFLGADWEHIEAVTQHIIATDADAPGRMLGEELARRLGPEKCSRVRWPDGVKDSNDILVKHGASDLAWFVEHAEPVPIEGVFGVEDLRDDILQLYEHGFERGKSTGWSELDRHYTVRPGEMTIVTGVPSSGKSNVIDCLTVNLGLHHGWRFAMFSPENLPLQQHMASILEKVAGKPFHEGPTARMTRAELDDALEWVGDHFDWILPSSEDDWTVEKILDAAGKLCLRHGIRGLVIDPWNELEAYRPPGMSETDFVSHALKRIRVFARQRGVHVWLVVHPTKLYRKEDGKYPVPTLYDCAGSAHWRNKADNGLVVWRDLSTNDEPEVQIHIQKIRFRHVGKRGIVKLYYETACATYRQWPDPAWGETDERYS